MALIVSRLVILLWEQHGVRQVAPARMERWDLHKAPLSFCPSLFCLVDIDEKAGNIIFQLLTQQFFQMKSKVRSLSTYFEPRYQVHLGAENSIATSPPPVPANEQPFQSTASIDESQILTTPQTATGSGSSMDEDDYDENLLYIGAPKVTSSQTCWTEESCILPSKQYVVVRNNKRHENIGQQVVDSSHTGTRSWLQDLHTQITWMQLWSQKR